MRHSKQIPGTLITLMRLTLLPERLILESRPDRSLLESALGAGVPLLHSCRGGSCGACSAQLVTGQVAYPHGAGLGLSDAERAAGQILLCRAHPTADVEVVVRTVRPAAQVEIRRLPCRVERLERLSPEVLGVHLRLPVIEPFCFTAGQHVDLILADGTRRAYSLAALPSSAARLELHVARVEGGRVSGALFGMIAPGAVLAIEGPFGALEPPSPTGPPLVFVAGGTGYAPLRALLLALIEAGWERPTRFYFGVRRAVDLYADHELRAFAAQYAHLHYVPVCEDGQGPADARCGRVHEAVLLDLLGPTVPEVYAAGPSLMIAALRLGLLERGLPMTQFDADAFG